MDRDDYIHKALNQLQDITVYKKLDGDPTDTYKREIDTILAESLEQGLITVDIVQLLTNDSRKVPIFYLIPKIHKGLEKPWDVL